MNEISSLRRAWAAPTHKENWEKNSKVFSHIMHNCKNICALDANFNKDSIKLLKYFVKDDILRERKTFINIGKPEKHKFFKDKLIELENEKDKG